MKKTLKKITLLFFACLFLMINSIGSNVAFGSYSNSQFQKTTTFEHSQEEAAIWGMIVAGVSLAAGTLVAVYEAGTVSGKAAYYYFGEQLAQVVVPVEDANDFSKFDI